MMRSMLYESSPNPIGALDEMVLAQGLGDEKIARHRGMKKAIVALARRLTVIMHRIWVNGTAFRWTREQAVAAT
jgi:transposase